MSNILIEILAEFTGKKAFKQADTAAATLAKSAKKLGAALGVAFSARAVIQYTKAASIAAAQDQKAQQLLAINLKNLGLAYANLDSEKFIATLEKQSAILDDELRPAYAQLARVTGSIATTQKLMTVAFDASNGSGLSYASTIDILSQAFVGNQKGLKQLNLGYTAAELKAKSFDEIIAIITNRFAGAGEAALSGYAGQMAKLNVATSNAAETLGGAFLDGFKSIAGGGDIDRATSKIDKFSEGLAGVIRVLTGVNDLGAMLKGVEWTGFLGLVPVAPKIAGAQSPGERKAIDAAAKKAEQERLKIAKELAKVNARILADKKLSAAIDKANLALNKSTDVFDMDKIQLNAAMINQSEQLGKVTSQAQLLALTNDVARIKVKQDILALEDAIASKNVEAITAATNQLNTDLGILGVLSGQKLKLTEIATILGSLAPKKLIDQDDLNAALDKIKAMMALLAGMNKGGGPSGPGGGPSGPGPGDGDGTKTTTKKDGGGTMSEGAPKLPKNTSTAAIVAATIGGTGLTATGFGAAKNDTQMWAKELADKAAKDAAAAAAVALTSTIGQASFTQGIGAGLTLAQSLSGARYAAQGAAQMGGGYVININTGVGDPNAIAETLDQYLQGAVDRGTLRLR